MENNSEMIDTIKDVSFLSSSAHLCFSIEITGWVFAHYSLTIADKSTNN